MNSTLDFLLFLTAFGLYLVIRASIRNFLDERCFKELAEEAKNGEEFLACRRKLAELRLWRRYNAAGLVINGIVLLLIITLKAWS